MNIQTIYNEFSNTTRCLVGKPVTQESSNSFNCKSMWIFLSVMFLLAHVAKLSYLRFASKFDLVDNYFQLLIPS